jgi:hypothetical protein
LNAEKGKENKKNANDANDIEIPCDKFVRRGAMRAAGVLGNLFRSLCAHFIFPSLR